MSAPRTTVTQRRQAIKARAHVISNLAFLRLLTVLALYTFPLTFLSDLLGKLQFGGPELSLFGIPVNLMREGILLLVVFLEAPLLLGSCEFLLGLDRERPLPVLSVFSWLGEGQRLWGSAKYALFQAGLSLVLFPLQRLPMLWTQANAEVYTDAVNAVMAAAQKGETVDLAVVETVTSVSSTLFLLELGMLAAALLCQWFAPLPYLFAESGGRCRLLPALRESIACMRGHFWEYTLFLLSMVGWFVLANLLSSYLCVIVYPYVYMAQTIFLNRLILSRRQKGPEAAADQVRS